MTASPDASRAAERVAREAYGRLVAWLAWRWNDVAAAEDAVSEALLRALERWPHEGVPRSPEAWLMTVARRELLQRARHLRMRQRAHAGALAPMPPEEVEIVLADESVPDERLRLLFTCAHPAIDPRVRTPLMLQVVLGFTAQEIGAMLLERPTTLAQRLVRAKRKIRLAGIGYETPASEELPARLHDVLEAIYGAFSRRGCASASGRPEARRLAALVCDALPDSAEALGLAALMDAVLARGHASIGDDGRFVPLADQPTDAWDTTLAERADRQLHAAAARRSPGPYQLEAAIQCAHLQRRHTGRTPWRSIALLYASLNRHHATLGSRLAEVVALAESGSLDRARACLSSLEAEDHEALARHTPWWIARARLAELTGKSGDAARHWRAAARHAEEPARAAWLAERAQRTAGR